LGGISGDYINACENEGDFSYQHVVSFQGNQMKLQSFTYLGESCDLNLLYGRHDRALIYSDIKDSKDLPGYRDYSLTQEFFTATPASVDAVMVYNQISRYGYNDWQLNSPKDVAGRASTAGETPILPNGTHLINTISNQGDEFQFAEYVNNKAVVSTNPSSKFRRR